MKALSLAVAALALSGAVVSAQQAGPKKFEDAKAVASMLIKKDVAQCVAKFDVSSVSSITQQQVAQGQRNAMGYPIGEKHQYVFEGTIVSGDIARGVSTLTIATEVKMGAWEPYWAYSCKVEDVIVPGAPK